METETKNVKYTPVKALKIFFEEGEMGRKVTANELKVIPAEERTELAKLVIDEIGGNLCDTNGHNIYPE
jgi:hypothetical protein